MFEGMQMGSVCSCAQAPVVGRSARPGIAIVPALAQRNDSDSATALLRHALDSIVTEKGASRAELAWLGALGKVVLGEGRGVAPEWRASIVSTASRCSRVTAGLLTGDFRLGDVSCPCFGVLCAAPDCEVSPGNAVPQLNVSWFTGRSSETPGPSTDRTATSADMRPAHKLPPRDKRRGVT